MKKWMGALAAACAVFVSPLSSCGEAQGAGADEFVRAVVLVKEGVRAPSESEMRLQKLDKAHTWTDWPVGAGRVTKRGKDLVRALWRSAGDSLRKDGLLPADACPGPETIYVRVDAMARSLDTASAVLEGLAPGCRMGYWAVEKDALDPLFHSLRAGYCPLRPQEAAADVIGSLPGRSLDALSASLSSELELLDSLLAPLNRDLCERYSLPNCRVSELATNVTVLPRGAGVFLSGGLGMAAGLADIFIMEAYQGSFSGIGTGAEGARRLMARLWSLRTAARNPVNNSRVVSSASASAMLKAMVDGLFGRLPKRKHAVPPKLVIYVGHDLVMGQTAGLAGLRWQIPGIVAQNPTLPGCGLTFELWRRPDGSQYVASRVLANAPKTLHSRELRDAEGRLKTERMMTLDVMDEQGRPLAMDAADFEAAMLSRIRMECVAPEPAGLKFFYPSDGGDPSAKSGGASGKDKAPEEAPPDGGGQDM